MASAREGGNSEVFRSSGRDNLLTQAKDSTAMLVVCFDIVVYSFFLWCLGFFALVVLTTNFLHLLPNKYYISI